MPNFKSLQSLLGVPSSFEDEEELYSKMPTKEEELEAYTSTPKWSAEQYKQSITPEHREELERQQKARERTEEFEKTLSEDMGPLGALGYHILKNIAFDERPASEFEEGGGGVYESTSPIDFITPAGVGATAKGISKAFARPGIRKAVVSEVLPATRFEKIKQAIPSSTIEGKVVTPQLAAEERLALPAPATEEPLGLPMPKQELPAPSTKSIEAMPIAESPVALEQAVEAETPAIVSSKPVARAKKSAVSQEPEPDRFIIPGMFLKTEQLIRQKMGKSASPQQIMGVLREAKPEELEYLGIPKFLEGQDKVTKEALLEHIKKSSPHLEEIPAKTLGFEVEQERLLEREALLSEELDNFETLTDDRDYLRNTLQKSGYSLDEALDIIDDLEAGSTEALQIFKNISPYQGESAELYRDNYLQNSSIMEELRQTGQALRTISTKDFPPLAKYYKLPSEQNLTLEHPKSRETYKEKLYSISRPHPEIRDGRKMTVEGAKIYDMFATKIKEETKRHEELEKSFNIPESFVKYENANARNREIEEPFKKALIEDHNLRYPHFIGTHLHQDSINFHINKRILEKLEKAPTVENKLSILDNLDISEDLKRFYKENILSNDEYRKNLNIIQNHLDRIDHATEELISSQSHINNIKNHRDRFIRETAPEFLESHWAEPNVFSHTRSTEFTAPNGERHLFAQELQSDWHQKIRDRNKKLQNLEKKLELAKLKGQNEKYNHIQNEINHLKFDINKMPKAPMSRTWHEFLTKRLLTDAAEGNFDNISWTTGDTQNERYSLEKFFSKINYNPETLDLVTFNLDGQVTNNIKVSPEDLPAFIGEDLSKKLLSTEPFGDRGHFLSGEDLKTGGEGMRGFYDEIIPSTMAKFGKKYGVKPEKVMMPDVGEIWTMKLTPEMKEYIKKYGFPMFMLPGFMQQEEVPEEKKEFKNINKLVKDKK